MKGTRKRLLQINSFSHHQATLSYILLNTDMIGCNFSCPRSNAMGNPSPAFSNQIISKITVLPCIYSKPVLSSCVKNTKTCKKQSLPSQSLIHAPCLILTPKALALKYLLRWVKRPQRKSNKGPLITVIEANT